MDLNSSLNSDNQPSHPALRPSSPTSITSVPAALRKTIQTMKPRKKRAKSVKKCTIYKPEYTGLLLQIMNKLSEQAVQWKECAWKLSHIEHVNINIGDLRKKAADKYEIYDVKPFFSTPEFSKGNFKLISNGRLIRHQVDECPFCHMIGPVDVCYDRKYPKKDHNGLVLQLLRHLVDDEVWCQKQLSTSRPDHVDIQVVLLHRKAIMEYKIIDLDPFFSSPEFSEANFELISDGKVIRHRLPTV